MVILSLVLLLAYWSQVNTEVTVMRMNDDPMSQSLFLDCLDQVQGTSSDWQTLILSSYLSSELSKEVLWEKWTKQSQKADLKVDQTITYPGFAGVWSKDNIGMKSCHFWTFGTISNGKTIIRNVEVIHGPLVGLIVKPFLGGYFQYQFDTATAELTK